MPVGYTCISKCNGEAKDAFLRSALENAFYGASDMYICIYMYICVYIYTYICIYVSMYK